MTKASKSTSRNGGPKAGEPAESPIEALEKALQAARGETMRAQRDLESARLEMAEQKRRNSQQALVASEALKEARGERDRLRVQLDGLRGEMSLAEKKRGGHPREGAADGELSSLREKLAEAESAAESVLATQRALESRLAESQAALADARRELQAHSSPPPASADAAPPPPQPRGIFGKLFGRR